MLKNEPNTWLHNLQTSSINFFHSTLKEQVNRKKKDEKTKYIPRVPNIVAVQIRKTNQKQKKELQEKEKEPEKMRK